MTILNKKCNHMAGKCSLQSTALAMATRKSWSHCCCHSPSAKKKHKGKTFHFIFCSIAKNFPILLFRHDERTNKIFNSRRVCVCTHVPSFHGAKRKQTLLSPRTNASLLFFPSYSFAITRENCLPTFSYTSCWRRCCYY